MRTACIVTLVAVGIGWPAAVAAQSPAAQAGTRAPAATGLAVDVRSRAVRPGEVLAIDVRSPDAITAMTATIGDRAIPIWRLAPRAWRALAGLDVEQASGPLALTVTATPSQGPPLTRTVTLEVQPAAFAERRLSVPPRFVEPPESERPRIEREAVRLRAIYDAVSADRQPAGFVAPVPHPRSSPFGARSVFNGVPRERHAGLDFASPAGAVIRAPAAGRVVLVGPLYWTGNTVVIDHGEGLYSILAHMTRTLVREGQTVARGARVGTVGATGRVTGPHLHWSVRLGSARVDPASVLDVLADAGHGDGR
jgi:murein DD-endopeptidase MepM/ murein hydrolase activator NlpD